MRGCSGCCPMSANTVMAQSQMYSKNLHSAITPETVSVLLTVPAVPLTFSRCCGGGSRQQSHVEVNRPCEIKTNKELSSFYLSELKMMVMSGRRSDSNAANTA